MNNVPVHKFSSCVFIFICDFYFILRIDLCYFENINILDENFNVFIFELVLLLKLSLLLYRNCYHVFQFNIISNQRFVEDGTEVIDCVMMTLL